MKNPIYERTKKLTKKHNLYTFMVLVFLILTIASSFFGLVAIVPGILFIYFWVSVGKIQKSLQIEYDKEINLNKIIELLKPYEGKSYLQIVSILGAEYESFEDSEEINRMWYTYKTTISLHFDSLGICKSFNIEYTF